MSKNVGMVMLILVTAVAAGLSRVYHSLTLSIVAGILVLVTLGIILADSYYRRWKSDQEDS
ncbi:hypothetical protein [Alkalibacillus aidingensis]|uniref:hypothetical protein n=1 Tax=Alkalibacillus aidingensis TaxID=2747607 RepID=UPI001661100B|nr:hypothetical protein [Alkalibacillus aidingensis]